MNLTTTRTGATTTTETTINNFDEFIELLKNRKIKYTTCEIGIAHNVTFQGESYLHKFTFLDLLNDRDNPILFITSKTDAHSLNEFFSTGNFINVCIFCSDYDDKKQPTEQIYFRIFADTNLRTPNCFVVDTFKVSKN